MTPDLMQPILDDPADDAARLIYADAIEETDPERAEYIRCQIHGGPEWLMVRLAANAEWSKKPEGIDHIVWRRGFPDSVTLPLARLVGGTCDVCMGSGAERWRVYDGTEEGSEREDSCQQCHGTGRTPGLARVIGQWPLSEIRLSDREPHCVAGSNRAIWFNVLEGDDERHKLPDELMRYFFNGHTGGLWKEFPTREAALAALSAACLSYVRDAVGRNNPAPILTGATALRSSIMSEQGSTTA